MNAIAGVRMKRPVHPGGFVKHEIIDSLGLSVTRAAEVPGRDARDALHPAQRAGPPFARHGGAGSKRRSACRWIR